MKLDNYKNFCAQLEAVIVEYPNLSILEKDDRKYLKGILDIPNENSIIVGSYLMEIHFSDRFPFRFPKLFEVGNDIPDDINWHKFPDSRCCITVLPDEIIKCKTGIMLLEFIEKYCFSFFANHIFRKKEGCYLNGEYSHGPEGLKEFYATLFKTNAIEKWIHYIKYVFLYIDIKYERNEKCFCNSNIKFKNCHLKIFDMLREIGLNQCSADLRQIFPNMKFDF